MIIASLISFIDTVSLRASLQGILKLVRYLVLFLAVTEEVKDTAHAQKIVLAIFLGVLVSSLDGLFQLYTGADFIRHRSSYFEEIGLPRLTAAFPHTNHFSSYLGLFLPLGIGWVLYDRQKNFSRRFVYITSILGLCCLLFTFSRSSFFGFLIALVFMGVIKKDRLLFAALLLMIAMIALFMPPKIRDWAKTTRSPVEFIWHAQKIGDWRNAVNMIRHHPFIGVGVNTYSLNFEKYIVRDGSRFHGEMGYAHNIYLHMMAEIGPLGLLAFLWLVVRLFKAGFGGYRSAEDPFLKILHLGILAGILGLLLDGIGQTVLYHSKIAILFWFYVGLLLAVVRCAKTSAGGAQEETGGRPILK